MIDHKLLKYLIKYYPETGNFTRLIRVTKLEKEVLFEKEAIMRTMDTGIYTVFVDEMRLPADKIAWYYMTGDYPDYNKIIHINGDITDNSWSNLKLDGELKIGGVNIDVNCNKWTGSFRYNDELIRIGMFYTEEEAENELSTIIEKVTIH